MKTKSTTKKTGAVLAFGAMLALSINANAQNSSYDADAVPVPGTGSGNALFGNSSLANNTTGSNNTALGIYVLNNNTTGYGNTASGIAAMASNTSGGENCAHGLKALASNQTGDGNTAVGYGALASTDYYYNTGIGYLAGITNQNGKYNTALGYRADFANTGMGNATAIGASAIVIADDQVWLGDANVVNNNVWSYGTYNTVSDGRFKTNISENDVKGLDFIKRLRPVVYNFDAKKGTEYMTKNMKAEDRKHFLDKDYSKATSVRQSGFIAQEVAEAAKATGYNFNGVHTPNNSDDVYGVSYASFVVPLVKAVQEQQAMIEKQNNLIENQGKLIEELKQQIQGTSANTGATGATGINTIKGADGFVMNQNEPNPFTHETVIRYTMPQSVNSAYVAVYDLSGKQITSFGLNDRGSSSITITSEKLSAGIYIYSVVADGKILDSKRMVVSEK